MNEELAVVATFSPGALAELLGLPAGAYIDAVSMSIDCPGTLTMRVRGVGSPVVPGRHIFPVRPSVTTYYDDEGKPLRREVAWDFPLK